MLAGKIRNGMVCGVGVHGAGLRAALIIKLMDKGWIAGETFGGGYFFDRMAFPEAACITKGGKARFSGNACARKNDDVIVAHAVIMAASADEGKRCLGGLLER